jgi:hypothetical protein
MPDSDAFDREVVDVVRRTLDPAPDGRYDLTVDATVVWGRPGGRSTDPPSGLPPDPLRT